MNTEKSSYLNSSMLAKASILTSITFTSIYGLEFCNYNKPFLKEANVKADTVLAKQKADSVIKIKKAKTIYLTFDDGPGAGTNNVINIIKQEKVTATMFIIGEHVHGSPSQNNTWNTMQFDSFLQICNHSYTHAFHNNFNKFYRESAGAINDFGRSNDSFHFTTNIIRTPGRNIWRTAKINFTDLKKSTQTADSLKRSNYNLIGWDLEWRFTRNQKLIQSDTLLVNEINNFFVKSETRTPGHLVLLMHDRTFKNSTDSAALSWMIQKLKSTDEYNFETLDKYPDILHP